MSEYQTALENKLKALSLSADAARWVMHALDPVRGGPCQIPDAIQVATLTPEWKTTTVLNCPTSGIPSGSNWDVCIISPPSDTIAFMYAIGLPGTDFSNTVAVAYGIVRNSQSTVSPDTQYNCFQVSTTTGALIPGMLGLRSTASAELPASWRTAARSLTVYATGSDLYNQGTVYSGQYARLAVPNGAAAIDPGSGQHVVLNVDVVPLPLNESEMATVTPGFYSASAREGVYSVHRLTGPAQDFAHARAPREWRSTNGAAINYSLSDPATLNAQTQHVARFFQAAPYALSPVFPPASADYGSTGFDQHCTWGVHIFRGLHPQMTLTVKSVVGLELVPTAEAPSRQFIKPPMRFEPTAIAAYYAIASEVPNSMAAKHNFLGSILPVLGSIASKVLPFLAPALASGAQALVQRFAPAAPAIAAPAPTPRRPKTRVVGSLRGSSIRSTRSTGSRHVKIAKAKRRVKR